MLMPSKEVNFLMPENIRANTMEDLMEVANKILALHFPEIKFIKDIDFENSNYSKKIKTYSLGFAPVVNAEEAIYRLLMELITTYDTNKPLLVRDSIHLTSLDNNFYSINARVGQGD